MSKRDYKSYNVLGDELEQDGIYEDSRCTGAQEIEVGFSSEAKSKEENTPKASMPETSQDVVEVEKIEKKQESPEDEVILHTKKRINLGKKLVKSKEVEGKKQQALVLNNSEMDSIDHAHSEIKESNKNIDVNNSIDKSKTINKNIDNRIVIGNRINKSKNISEIQEEVDMTFSGYKNYYQTKERSKLVKWSLRLAKFILTIMLLPLIAIIAGAIALFVGGFLTVIVLSIGAGIIILGTICFMSTQVNASLIALGIAVSVTAISFGGILFVLFYMLVKWSIDLLKKYKKPRKQSIKKEER